MNGYDILAHILCEKAELDLLNRTSFEIVMELTGIRFDTTWVLDMDYSEDLLKTSLQSVHHYKCASI